MEALNEKIYRYKFNCFKCQKPLVVKFVYENVIRKSVGYCQSCDFPVIVARRSNRIDFRLDLNEFWVQRDIDIRKEKGEL